MRSLSLLSSILLLTACQQADESLATRQAMVGERDAIERYAKAAEQTWELQNVWVSESADAVTRKTAEAIGEAFAKDVAPALAAYRDALEAMPVESDGLRAIHDDVVAAHTRLLDAYRTFADGLARENYSERIQALRAETSRFHAAERTYVDRLRKHYEAHGFELLPDPPVRLVALEKPPK